MSSRAQSCQEHVLRTTIRVQCKCGRGADVKLALRVGLDYPCLRARPNPYSGAVSSMVDTWQDTQVDAQDTQTDPPDDGNVMSLIGEEELDILEVAAPDLPTEGASSSDTKKQRRK